MPKHYHTCLPCQREVDWRQGTNCWFIAFACSISVFLYYKLFCRQDGGIVTPTLACINPSKTALSLEKHYILARPRKRVRFCCSVKPSQLCGDVNALVVFMVVLLSIPIPSHRTTPSKTALSHSLFVGRGACPSRNITAIIENKLIELYCKT